MFSWGLAVLSKHCSWRQGKRERNIAGFAGKLLSFTFHVHRSNQAGGKGARATLNGAERRKY
jgi:hypothetical protein